MAMGGIGEAMLLGAAMGGGSAALTGGDPLKGALLGGLTGGAGAGISGALTSALNPAVSLATTVPAAAASSMAPTIANAAALTPTAAAIPAATTSIAPAAASSVAPAANALGSGTYGIMPTATSGGLPSLLTKAAATPAAGTLGSGTFGIMPTATGGGISDLFTKAGVNPAVSAATPAAPETFAQGMKKFMDDPLASIKRNPITAASSAYRGATGARKKPEEEEEYDGPLSRFRFNPDTYQPAMYAEGGIANLAGGGYDRMVGEQPMYQAMARGGSSDLGSYSDYARGGRMLKGPGDGMSDSIPASIAGKRPARLADGEFVIPADVVSHLGNGSTDAGAKQLYAMMNKVRQARTGRKAQGREINPRRYMAA